jgi:predicted nucleic acid-binding protein
LIPPAVHAEVTGGGTGALDLKQATWLAVRAPSDTAAVARLRRVTKLDDGEAEAIELAGELGTRLIVDEYQGRQITQARGIPIIGTIGLIVEASRAGLIVVEDVEPLLRQMVRARFRISERLIRHAAALAREHA